MLKSNSSVSSISSDSKKVSSSIFDSPSKIQNLQQPGSKIKLKIQRKTPTHQDDKKKIKKTKSTENVVPKIRKKPLSKSQSMGPGQMKFGLKLQSSALKVSAPVSPAQDKGQTTHRSNQSKISPGSNKKQRAMKKGQYASSRVLMTQKKSMKELMLHALQYLHKGSQICPHLLHNHGQNAAAKPNKLPTPEDFEQPAYDYKGLLSANVNLIDIIDSGGTVNFDCPPMNFNQIDYTSIPKEELDYFRSAKCDDKGKIIYSEFEQKMAKIIEERRKKNNMIFEANSPTFLPSKKTHHCCDHKEVEQMAKSPCMSPVERPKKNNLMKEIERQDYLKNPTIQVRQYSKFWNMIINKSVGDNIRDENIILAAYEGGHRLYRRDKNIYTAFTYGKKLKYCELDDPGYVQKIKNKGKYQKIIKQRRQGLVTNESVSIAGSVSPLSPLKPDREFKESIIDNQLSKDKAIPLVEVPENEEIENTISSKSDQSITSQSLSVTVSKHSQSRNIVSRTSQKKTPKTPQRITSPSELVKDEISIILEEKTPQVSRPMTSQIKPMRIDTHQINQQYLSQELQKKDEQGGKVFVESNSSEEEKPPKKKDPSDPEVQFKVFLHQAEKGMRLDHRILQNVKRISVAQRLKERYSYMPPSTKISRQASPSKIIASTQKPFSPLRSQRNLPETLHTENISRHETQQSNPLPFSAISSPNFKFNLTLKFSCLQPSEKTRPQTAKANFMRKTIEQQERAQYQTHRKLTSKRTSRIKSASKSTYNFQSGGHTLVSNHMKSRTKYIDNINHHLSLTRRTLAPSIYEGNGEIMAASSPILELKDLDFSQTIVEKTLRTNRKKSSIFDQTEGNNSAGNLIKFYENEEQSALEIKSNLRHYQKRKVLARSIRV